MHMQRNISTVNQWRIVVQKQSRRNELPIHGFINKEADVSLLRAWRNKGQTDAWVRFAWNFDNVTISYASSRTQPLNCKMRAHPHQYAQDL